MNEVEKMYKLVNVKAINIAEYGSTYISNSVEIDGKLYSPFTAEKQLGLIKWIAEYKEECRITYEKEYKWCTQTDWQSSFCYDNFPASLANLINNLWQDLSEEERNQIKEILEQ